MNTSVGDPGKLFDAQIATLKDRRCPGQILTMLAKQRSDVVSKASQMTFKEGRISFLPVIPCPYLYIYAQVAMVQTDDGRMGDTGIDASQIANVIETPSEPYYIFDIEDGTATRGTSVQRAEDEIKKAGRRGLTAVEAIALCIHTDALSRHNVDAVGSRFGSDEVPFLYVCGEPRLGWHGLVYDRRRWGVASCALT